MSWNPSLKTCDPWFIAVSESIYRSQTGYYRNVLARLLKFNFGGGAIYQLRELSGLGPDISRSLNGAPQVRPSSTIAPDVHKTHLNSVHARWTSKISWKLRIGSKLWSHKVAVELCLCLWYDSPTAHWKRDGAASITPSINRWTSSILCPRRHCSYPLSVCCKLQVSSHEQRPALGWTTPLITLTTRTVLHHAS